MISCLRNYLSSNDSVFYDFKKKKKKKILVNLLLKLYLTIKNDWSYIGDLFHFISSKKKKTVLKYSHTLVLSIQLIVTAPYRSLEYPGQIIFVVFLQILFSHQTTTYWSLTISSHLIMKGSTFLLLLFSYLFIQLEIAIVGCTYRGGKNVSLINWYFSI